MGGDEGGIHASQGEDPGEDRKEDGELFIFICLVIFVVYRGKGSLKNQKRESNCGSCEG